MKVSTPPIKPQGIKTKLVPWIGRLVDRELAGRWIEPFMGTGVVGFNLAQEGARLADKGEAHYYKIRDRFNQDHQPLDFLFLNRAGFNGMIRFNRQGDFNVPFCRKPGRFAPAYITKIVNQVSHVARRLQTGDFIFTCQGFEETIRAGGAEDMIYCDPPYLGRHTDYYNGWDGQLEKALFKALSRAPGKFILSTWHHNDYRENEYINSLWSQFNVLTRAHFYHVGASEANRRPMVEALITNCDSAFYARDERQDQGPLLERHRASGA